MTTLARPRAASAQRPRGTRFGRLLLLLVFTYVLSAFTKGDLVSSVQVVLFLGVMLLALRTGRLQRRVTQVIAIGLLVGTVGALILQLADSHGPGAGVANMWTALVLLSSAFFVVRQVLSQPEITLQSIYGAISAYMILGLMFAAVYAGMEHFSGTFFVQAGNPSINTFQYFSFVTLTTVGYGDYTAAQAPGQAIAVIEAMTGQIFLATLVARLVAGFRGRAATGQPSGGGYPSGLAGAASPADPPAAGPAAGPADPPPGRGTGGSPAEPAGGRRARSWRASASGLVRLRPPGAVRRRAGPVRPPSSPGRASRARR
jgi:voltage-gated potassium channel Kch